MNEEQINKDRRDVGDIGAEEALEILQAVFDAIPDVLGVQDRHRHVLRYNQAGYDFLGLTPEQVAGRRCYELIGRESPCETCATYKAIATGKPSGVLRYEQSMDRWFDVRAYPIMDRKGRVYRIVEHLRDVTEERRLQERMARIERLELVGRLAAGLAHDFNNLLAPILGFADLLRQKNGDSEELLGILSAAKQARRLTSQLLDMARSQQSPPPAVEVGEVFSESEAVLRHLVPKNVRLSICLADPGTRVGLGRNQLEQILMNLAVNAIDAMPDGGELSISAARRGLAEVDLEIFPGLSSGEYLELNVSDTGLGISTEILGHIFEPFYSTKEQGSGTGLGLACVYGLLQGLGGGIWVRTELGAGSTFTVLIPLADGPSAT